MITEAAQYVPTDRSIPYWCHVSIAYASCVECTSQESDAWPTEEHSGS